MHLWLVNFFTIILLPVYLTGTAYHALVYYHHFVAPSKTDATTDLQYMLI